MNGRNLLSANNVENKNLLSDINIEKKNLLSAKSREKKDEFKNNSVLILPKEIDKEDILFNSTKNIKQDILIFKDEILKEMKIFKNILNERVKNNEIFVSENVEKFSFQIEGFNQKIIELSNLIVTDKSIREKVEQIIEFKGKAQDTIMTDGIRIDNLEKEFYENIYRIDNILKDTVLNSKIIGGIAKFNTFYDFMKIVVDEISQLNTFKDKTISDLNIYRNKLENSLNNMKKKVEISEKDTKLYTDKFIKKTEIKLNDLFEEYNNRLNDLKLQNVSYVENIKKLSDDLLTRVNNIILIKNELFNKFEEHRKDNLKISKLFSGYKEDYYNLKKKYLEIANILKYKGDFKTFNFELKNPLKSAYIKNKKRNLKAYKRIENDNILKINKIEFDGFEEKNNDFNSFKPEKKGLFKSTIGFEQRRSHKFGSLSNPNNKINIPLTKLFENKAKKIDIAKSVVKPFKIMNDSNDSNNKKITHSVIKEEEDNKEEELYSKRDKSTQSNNNIDDKNNSNNNNDFDINNININEAFLKDNKVSNNNPINQNEEINEIKTQKTFNKTNNYFIKNNILPEKITINNNQNKKEELNKNNKYHTEKNLKKITKFNDAPSNVIKKVTISIEGGNGLDVYQNRKKNNTMEKLMFNNLKNMINKEQLRNKSYNGYPKIVTNNGERIIISTRPINNSDKFIHYTNPNILALNKCVQKIYGNKERQKLKENDLDFFFESTNNLNTNQNNDYDLDNLKKNIYEEKVANEG